MALTLDSPICATGSCPTTPGLCDTEFSWDLLGTNDLPLERQFWNTSVAQTYVVPPAPMWPELTASGLEAALRMPLNRLETSSAASYSSRVNHASTTVASFAELLATRDPPHQTQEIHIETSPSAESGTPRTPQTTTMTLALPSSSQRKRRYDDMNGSYKETKVVDESGNLAGTLGVFGNSKPTRQPYTAEKKELTLGTRRRGACDRCQKSKKRCDRPESPYECCKNCRPHILAMPCFLAKITDALLFRDKPSPKHPKSSLRSQIFESLADIDRHRHVFNIELTQDFGEQLVVPVALYLPQESENTYRVWKDKLGQPRRLDMPPICIADMRGAAKQNMLNYIRSFRSAFLRSMFTRSNQITAEIFDQAHRFSCFEPNSMVSMALDLCAACRIIERDWRICSDGNIGIDIVEDPESPWCGLKPITPMMDAQLDQIVIQEFLKPLREDLLEKLDDKIRNFRREEWFEIFLTICILLSHAEWLLDHSRRNAIRCGSSTRYNFMPRADGYFHACKTMLAFFHHVCQGAAPLSINWESQKASRLAALGREDTQFMLKLQEKIRAKQTYLLSLRENSQYETELYWTHQLFFPGWRPGCPDIINP